MTNALVTLARNYFFAEKIADELSYAKRLYKLVFPNGQLDEDILDNIREFEVALLPNLAALASAATLAFTNNEETAYMLLGLGETLRFNSRVTAKAETNEIINGLRKEYYSKRLREIGQ